MFYIMRTVKSMGYTNEPANYVSLKENEVNPMLLTYAEKSFSHDWNVNDLEENEYWNSFVK